MTATTQLDWGLSVCDALSPADLPPFTSRFCTIINDRPEAEQPAQPSSATIEAAARVLGFEYARIPVDSATALRDGFDARSLAPRLGHATI